LNKPNPVLGVEVTGVGIGLPLDSVTNEEYLERYGPIIKDGKPVTMDNVDKMAGVDRRGICREDETLADLMTSACLEAINEAGLPVGTEIDKILVGTASSYKYRWNPGVHLSVLQRVTEAGWPSLNSSQLDAMCASFGYQWNDAYRHFATGEVDRVLVVGGDTVSRVVDRANPDTLMMGDGAGAILMERKDGDAGAITYWEDTDPEHENQMVTEVEGTLDMRDGPGLAEGSIGAIGEGYSMVLKWAGVQIEQVKLVVPHQASARIVKMARRRLDGIQPEQIVLTADKYGNTSSGSVPMALHHAWRDGLIGNGDLILAASVGAGLSKTAVLARLKPTLPEN